MSSKPNKMGRIESDPKPKKNFKPLLTTLAIFALYALGVATTLFVQESYAEIKRTGVSEYKSSSCEKFMNEDKSLTWLECEPTRLENNK